MKRLFILVTVLLFVFLGLTNVSAEPEKKKEKAAASEKAVKKTVTDANAPVDVNTPVDPNELLRMQYPEVTKAVNKIAKKGRKEMNLLRRLKAEGSIDLLNAANEQVIIELGLLRELAFEEGAKRTATAIDLLLVSRNERFEKAIQKLKKEKEKLQQRRQRGERRRPSRK